MTAPAFAQNATLRGIVTDQTGAIIPGATITLSDGADASRSATSDPSGNYSIGGLIPGPYTLNASAPDMVLGQPLRLEVKSGTQTHNLKLQVQAVIQNLNVEAEGIPSVSTDATNNASSTVLRGTDLDALSDNPNDLADDLQALAGPAAGPNGGSIYIDGFSGGELPPKNAIREIRINQNPFSPEYDKLGFGRIEIFTKPGFDKFHGSIGYNFANDFWNSRNPYAAQKAPFHLDEFSGSLAGPLNKRASFNLDVTREMNDSGNVINVVTLDPQTLVTTPFTGSVLSYDRWTRVTPRVDYQLSPNHTLSMRYAYNRDDVRNAGTGAFNLVSRGYHNDARSHTVQVTETAVLNANSINETRFQYFRSYTVSQANTAGYALQVLGAFNSGGNPIGHSTDTQNNYEVQNYTSMLHRAHALKFGVRVRGQTEAAVSPQNFAGTFTFGGGLAPELDANNQPVLDASGQPVLVNISSIESYRRTLLFQQSGFSGAQIRQLGGGATQFTINAGNPLVSGGQFDVGAFLGDDWKARSNLTVSMGLRYESQSNIHDWRDFAPRIGLAWVPGGAGGKTAKTVLRAGFGIFYDRFNLSNTLTALRYNGVVQQQVIVTNPDFFPAVPIASSLSGSAPPSARQQISSNLRAPYLMQSAVGLERQMPLRTTIAITYANSHGLHQLRSHDINAPLPGTFSPEVAGSGVFPLGRPGQVFLMESAGLYNQNQLIVNVNSKVNPNISLTGSYSYNRAMSNTDGLGTFAANPYSMAGEYGPAATDVHHRAFVGGSITPIWGIRLNPLFIVSTGPPFDITVGRDLYGDTLFNGRPGIERDANRPGVIATRYGLLDPNPIPGETLLSRNLGRGPGQIMLNMRVGRTFAFGAPREPAASGHSDAGGAPPRGASTGPFSIGGGGGGAASSDRRYSLTISMYIRNLTNHNNPGAIIGNITSPLFGKANQPFAGVGAGIFTESANNRRLELQTRFTF
ncbi:MAG TPA: carboxypeptidase regulatory-like domain-containing protein [Terriglobales bacterium]|nr:carboxypeptidase regulatory-like domain-containing protein [Terriglobales bacterium]